MKQNKMKKIYNSLRGFIALLFTFVFFYSISISSWFLLTAPLFILILTFLTIEIE
jgi:hypothetical protein